jgi:hypothetical protein
MAASGALVRSRSSESFRVWAVISALTRTSTTSARNHAASDWSFSRANHRARFEWTTVRSSGRCVWLGCVLLLGRNSGAYLQHEKYQTNRLREALQRLAERFCVTRRVPAEGAPDEYV